MLLGNRKIYTIFLLVGFLFAACSPSNPVSPPSLTAPSVTIQPLDLIPYFTATAILAPSPSAESTAAPLPSPSPTPSKHTIVGGEDMGGIASRYRITLQALLAANPDVNPNLMSVGMVLNIPASAAPASTDPAPKPTPIPVAIDAVQCSPSQDGGLWCFLPVHNNQKTTLESISAVIRIAGQATRQVISQVALPPLDSLLPGATIPLAAYFPAPVPQPFQASAELLTAMPLPDGNTRYMEARLDHVQVDIASNSLAARLHGEIIINTQKAKRIWVAAVAVDTSGKIVGVRRWENNQPSKTASPIQFDFYVYSTGARIRRVDLIVEARP